MELFDFAREVLLREKIEYVSVIALGECEIVRGYLLERAGLGTEKGSAIMLAVPYYAEDVCTRNISAYAVPRDYHAYFTELFERVLPIFRERFPNNRFVGFSDRSPINEIRAAAMSRLGVIGKNHLLITEKYSSFVFLGEIICDIEVKEKAEIPRECEGCGLCEHACPVELDRTLCLSSLTQKKGELSENEKKLIFDGGSAWGCDKCQTACPHSKNISETKIEFFREKRIPVITSEIINCMSEKDFAERAYSWRGKETTLRNLRIFEEKK